MHWQAVSNWATVLLSFTTLAGLVVRRRARRSYAFTFYLVVIAAQGTRLAFAGGPGSWQAWLFVETVLRVLCVIVAFEIAVRLFGSLPGAARGARRAILCVVGCTVGLLLVDIPGPCHPPFIDASPVDVTAFATAQRLLPRLAYGSAWLFAALYAVAAMFVLPVDPLHRLILLGLGAYLVLYAVTFATLPAIEPHASVVNVVQSFVFVGLLGVWGYAAWRIESPPVALPAAVRRLWPWH